MEDAEKGCFPAPPPATSGETALPFPDLYEAALRGEPLSPSSSSSPPSASKQRGGSGMRDTKTCCRHTMSCCYCRRKRNERYLWTALAFIIYVTAMTISIYGGYQVQARYNALVTRTRDGGVKYWSYNGVSNGTEGVVVVIQGLSVDQAAAGTPAWQQQVERALSGIGSENHGAAASVDIVTDKVRRGAVLLSAEGPNTPAASTTETVAPTTGIPTPLLKEERGEGEGVSMSITTTTTTTTTKGEVWLPTTNIGDPTAVPAEAPEDATEEDGPVATAEPDRKKKKHKKPKKPKKPKQPKPLPPPGVPLPKPLPPGVPGLPIPLPTAIPLPKLPNLPELPIPGLPRIPKLPVPKLPGLPIPPLYSLPAKIIRLLKTAVDTMAASPVLPPPSRDILALVGDIFGRIAGGVRSPLHPGQEQQHDGHDASASLWLRQLGSVAEEAIPRILNESPLSRKDRANLLEAVQTEIELEVARQADPKDPLGDAVNPRACMMVFERVLVHVEGWLADPEGSVSGVAAVEGGIDVEEVEEAILEGLDEGDLFAGLEGESS